MMLAVVPVVGVVVTDKKKEPKKPKNSYSQIIVNSLVFMFLIPITITAAIMEAFLGGLDG